MASTLELLRRLTREKVEFVVVGGVAAIAHGSATVTEDLDVCIRFDLDSMTRVFAALAGINPRQRMHPDRLPLGADPSYFVGNKNLYLTTDEGVLDLLGDILTVGGHDRVAAQAVTMSIADLPIRVIGLDDLLACKRALGRPRDKQVVAELEHSRGIAGRK